jgi:glycosyltransferase involved in cell wall biosynthesis
MCHGVDVYRIWTTRFGRGSLPGRACDYLSFYCSAWWTLMMIARRQDVIVAKTDPPLISLVGALVARLKGARLINWLQDLFPEVALHLGVVRAGAILGLLRQLRNWSLKVASVNVAIGSRMAQLLGEEGATPQSVAVIHNWADPGLITPTPSADNPLREEWGLTDQFVVGYSGNLGRAHEFDTMLGAAEILAADPSISFLFIGGGHGNGQLREATATRGLSNVQFRPYQPQRMLAQSLAVPDVHLVSLLPAMEGLIVPSKIYGIAAAGRPCIFIGDASGEVADLLEEGGFGLVVTPGDSQALADAIRKLHADPAQLQVQMSSARQYFEDHHTTEHSVARWEALLRALANKD